MIKILRLKLSINKFSTLARSSLLKLVQNQTLKNSFSKLFQHLEIFKNFY